MSRHLGEPAPGSWAKAGCFGPSPPHPETQGQAGFWELSVLGGSRKNLRLQPLTGDCTVLRNAFPFSKASRVMETAKSPRAS